jgi:hypothetical protein
MTQLVRQSEGALGPVTYDQVTLSDMEQFGKCSACGAVVHAPASHSEFHRRLDRLMRES